MDINKSKCILLTVADEKTGLGHLFRTDALAQAIQNSGLLQTELVIACREGKSWLRQKAPQTDYCLQNWNCHADDVKEAISGAAIIVVDAYDIGVEVWDELRNSHALLAVFDDTGEKPHFCGVLINGGPGAHLVSYRKIPGQELLLGTEYQVLRPPFWEGTPRIVSDRIKSVLLMAGGTDHSQVIDSIVDIACKVLDAEADIRVIGTQKTFVDARVTSLGFLSAAQLKQEFDAADMLITAAGQTVAEAVSCSLPCIMLQTIGNQAKNVQGWRKHGVAQYAGKTSDDIWRKQLERGISVLNSKKQRSKQVENAKSLAINDSTRKLTIRLLVEICQSVPFFTLSEQEKEMVFAWRNYESVRRWMDNPECIEWDNHLAFINGLQQRNDKKYYLVKAGTLYLGIINLVDIDEKKKVAELGVYKNPELHSVNIGRLLMLVLEKNALKLRINTLRLKVRLNNKVAINLYRNCNYQEVSNDQDYQYMIKEISR